MRDSNNSKHVKGEQNTFTSFAHFNHVGKLTFGIKEVGTVKELTTIVTQRFLATETTLKTTIHRVVFS